MSVIAALRDACAAVLPPPAWAWSMERLHDGASDRAKRYGVVKSAGGGGGDVVRTPLFTVDVVGLPTGDVGVAQAEEAAQTLIAALRESAGPVAVFEPGEPVPSRGAEGRPIYSVAVAATLIDD